jgi:hypothetical protein
MCDAYAKNEDDLTGSSETWASPSASQTSAYEKGPNGSCAIRPGFVSYCFASGDGPDRRVASLGVVRTNQLRRRGSTERRAGLRASIEGGAPAPEDHRHHFRPRTWFVQTGRSRHLWGDVLCLTGHLSRRMLEHYSHLRLKAKKAALDRLDGSTKRTSIKTCEVGLQWIGGDV